MQSFLKAIILPLLLVSPSLAICPGFNYGIGNVQALGGGINRWNVYDDSCNVVDGLTTTNNPCTEGIFGCSPPPVIFNEYTNTFTGLRYACRTDPNSGTCGSDVISVCVSRYIPNTGVFSTVFPGAATTEINPEWPKPKGSI